MEKATRGEYTEPSVCKISTLDFVLLLVFITFTIIRVNKNLIFSEVVLDTILKFETLHYFRNSMRNQRKPNWTLQRQNRQLAIANRYVQTYIYTCLKKYWEFMSDGKFILN